MRSAHTSLFALLIPSFSAASITPMPVTRAGSTPYGFGEENSFYDGKRSKLFLIGLATYTNSSNSSYLSRSSKPSSSTVPALSRNATNATCSISTQAFGSWFYEAILLSKQLHSGSVFNTSLYRNRIELHQPQLSIVLPMHISGLRHLFRSFTANYQCLSHSFKFPVGCAECDSFGHPSLPKDRPTLLGRLALEVSFSRRLPNIQRPGRLIVSSPPQAWFQLMRLLVHRRLV